MPLRLFRSRNVTGANVVQALLVVGMFGMFFLGALYLQQVLGYDALAGRPRVPAVDDRDGRDVAAPARRRWPMRFGTRSTVLAEHRADRRRACCCSPARRSTAATWSTSCRAMVLVGLGAGLGFPGLMTLAMSGATPQDAGLASGLVNTSVQVGGAIGLAVLATLATERTDALVADGAAHAAALNSGFHLAYLIGAGVLAVAVVVAAGTLREPQAAQAPAAPRRAPRRARPAYAEA